MWSRPISVSEMSVNLAFVICYKSTVARDGSGTRTSTIRVAARDSRCAFDRGPRVARMIDKPTIGYFKLRIYTSTWNINTPALQSKLIRDEHYNIYCSSHGREVRSFSAARETRPLPSWLHFAFVRRSGRTRDGSAPARTTSQLVF